MKQTAQCPNMGMLDAIEFSKQNCHIMAHSCVLRLFFIYGSVIILPYIAWLCFGSSLTLDVRLDENLFTNQSKSIKMRTKFLAHDFGQSGFFQWAIFSMETEHNSYNQREFNFVWK